MAPCDQKLPSVPRKDPCDRKDPFITGNDRPSSRRDRVVVIARCQVIENDRFLLFLYIL
jgi:hypothetical protein